MNRRNPWLSQSPHVTTGDKFSAPDSMYRWMSQTGKKFTVGVSWWLRTGIVLSNFGTERKRWNLRRPFEHTDAGLDRKHRSNFYILNVPVTRVTTLFRENKRRPSTYPVSNYVVSSLRTAPPSTLWLLKYTETYWRPADTTTFSPESQD